MRSTRRPLSRHAAAQRGQALYIIAMLLAVIGGLAALAVDLGSYMADRRDLQNAADAIALAAAQGLPDESDAEAIADEWAEKNDIAIEQMALELDGNGQPNPTAQVHLARDHGFTFARLIGISSTEVSVNATGVKTSASGGDGVVPLAVTEDALLGITYGDPVTLKYDARDIFQGNTGPIRIDGPGSGNCGSTDNFCDGVEFGSENSVCADGTVGVYCEGLSVVDTEPGNKIGATRTAINWRLDNTDAQCDGFGEVFEDDPTTAEAGVYHIVQGCNPFLSESLRSERVLIIPVIQQLCNGACAVTIVDFALFYLEGFQNGSSCRGNACEVIGRFVRVSQNIGLLSGAFNPASANQFVRLVQ